MKSDRPETLAELLCCPQSHERLLPVTKKWCDRINARIAAGELRDEAGNVVTEPVDDGFVTPDDRFLYPVRNGVPNLFVSDRIVLADSAG